MAQDSLFPLDLPPGFYRNGTDYQAKGRWFTGNLVRFTDKTIRPLGGWQELEASNQETEITVVGFSDSFAGTADTPLSSHTADFPATAGWSSADQAATYELDGSGNVRPATETGSADLIFSDVVVDPLHVGYEAWIEIAFPVVSGGYPGGVGFSFAKDSASAAFLSIRFYPTPHSGNTGWDFFNGILCNAWNTSGVDQPNQSISFSATPDLAGSTTHRLGITVTATTSPHIKIDIWYAPAGGGTKTVMATWEGDSIDISPTYLGSTYTGFGLFMEPESGSASVIKYAAAAVQSTTTAATTEVTLDGVPRAIIGWRGNDGNQLVAIGTNTKLYALTIGQLFDITPSGFVPGTIDPAFGNGGYGDGPYSAGPYGISDPNQETIEPPALWDLDTFGDFLVGSSHPNDGKLYYWDKNVTHKAQAMPNAPENNRGIVVTPESFIVALGAEGESRRLDWASQFTLDVWTPAEGNSAEQGRLLEGTGTIVTGRRTKSETLVWTDDDLHVMRYIGGDLIYQIDKIGSKCGLIAKGAVALVDTKAIWMGARQFFIYDGYVRQIPSEVSDYVFGRLNRDMAAKIVAVPTSQFGEIRWHYPSIESADGDNDSYVTYNHLEDHWTTGDLQRTAGTDAGALRSPIYGAQNGKLYEHERSLEHNDLNGDPIVPYLESGTVELANGDVVVYVDRIVPDERTLGDGQLSLYTKSPTMDDAERLRGPFTIANQTGVRFSAHQVRLRFDQVREVDWRLGTIRLALAPGGNR